MSLLDLSWRNIKRNFRTYSLYFASMVNGVIIYFTFSSLMFHDDILSTLENKDNFQLGVTIASVAVFLFIIFFILYANSFFMRQRKQEIGMCLLFGTEKPFKSSRLLALLSILFLGTAYLLSNRQPYFGGIILRLA